MSGPKKADVQFKLGRQKEMVRRKKEAIEENRRRFRESASRFMEKSKKEAERTIDNIRPGSPSDNVRKFAIDEWNKAQSLLEEAKQAIRQGSEKINQCQSVEKEAQRILQQAEQIFNNAEAKWRQVNRMLDSSSDSHYKRKEDQMADEAQSLYNQWETKENEASGKFGQLENLTPVAKTDFDSAIRKAILASQAFEKAREIGTERCRAEEEAKRIREEKKRNARTAISEMEMWQKQVGALEHGKFAPGKYNSVISGVSHINSEFNNGNFDEATFQAQAVSRKLVEIAEEVQQKKEIWERERQEAQDAIEQTQAEFSGFDVELINHLTRNPKESQVATDTFDSAKSDFDREQFKEAVQKCRNAREIFKRLQTQAIEIDTAIQQRNDIADAIIDSLKEMNFYEPESCYQVEDDDTSNLIIFAESPSGQGNIKMEIERDGKINMDVQKEAYEGACVDSLRSLQQRLEQIGVDFEVTDWGRARQKAEGEVGTRQKIQVQEKESVRIRQRG